jgi:catechol 2,3-dioxygenase-like lactoylglutathione lyase family enzyme
VIEGLSHLTFVVADLERSTRLIVEVLGGRQVHDSGPVPPGRSRDRFFVAGGLWIALLEGARPAERSYDHVAFKIAPEHLAPARAALDRLGLAVEQGRPRAPGEARSLYFHDWDGHLFELHTGTLDDRLAAEAARR